MNDSLSRRGFLKSGLLGAAALAVPAELSRVARAFPTGSANAIFRPYPHANMPTLKFVYAADEHVDPFKSAIQIQRDGIVVDEDMGERRFSVNARWLVEGFGYLWLSADNEGRFYTRESAARMGMLNLNYEFARSRVARNRSVLQRYQQEGTEFSPDVRRLVSLSEEFLESATRKLPDGDQAARLADTSLRHALWAGETIELEKARSEIARRELLERTFFGCETRQFVWAKSEEFTKRFPELFDFATVTHYVWDSWYELFEPREGRYNWGIKDDIVKWLMETGITIEGRPLFWFHPTVTPAWLKGKTFDQLKQYMVKHAHDLVSHYGNDVLQWEVVNEYHDWANIHNHSEDQITELVRLACDTTKETNSRVVRIINNCCPWAEYAAIGRMARMDATRPLRSPRKFLSDLAGAGVDYDVLGIQLYFPQRDLSDVVRLLERLAALGKPIYVTEIGASSNLLARSKTGEVTGSPSEPFDWHRPWDEELQADWLEQMYTILYSKPYIKAVNWYDFSDFRPFIVNGGLVREDCSTKQSFMKLKTLLASWNRLPTKG